MKIKCKKAPLEFGWLNPRRRFIFSNDEWQDRPDRDIAILRKKLKNKFDDLFLVKEEIPSGVSENKIPSGVKKK
jgi:hypothetical protein